MGYYVSGDGYFRIIKGKEQEATDALNSLGADQGSDVPSAIRSLLGGEHNETDWLQSEENVIIFSFYGKSRAAFTPDEDDVLEAVAPFVEEGLIHWSGGEGEKWITRFHEGVAYVCDGVTTYPSSPCEEDH